MGKLTKNQKDMIRELRECGFAVVMYNPDELKGVDPDIIESELVHVGNDMIHNLAVDDNG